MNKLSDIDTARYYTNCAEYYIENTQQLKILRLWGLALQYFKGNGRILDLGSGSGRDLRFFKQLGYCCIGLDYSYTLAKHAKNYSNSPVVVGDFHAMPFKEDTFDGIWAIASLLHVRKSQINLVLRQVYNCLKNEGFFISSMKVGKTTDRDSTGRLYEKYTQELWEQQLIHARFLPITTFNDGNWINCVVVKTV